MKKTWNFSKFNTNSFMPPWWENARSSVGNSPCSTLFKHRRAWFISSIAYFRFIYNPSISGCWIIAYKSKFKFYKLINIFLPLWKQTLSVWSPSAQWLPLAYHLALRSPGCPSGASLSFPWALSAQPPDCDLFGPIVSRTSQLQHHWDYHEP